MSDFAGARGTRICPLRPQLISFSMRKDDATSLDHCIRQLFPDLSTELIALDIRRDGKEVEHDLLRDQPYSDLSTEPWRGNLTAWGVAPIAAHGASFDGPPSREHLHRYVAAGNQTAGAWTASTPQTSNWWMMTASSYCARWSSHTSPTWAGHGDNGQPHGTSCSTQPADPQDHSTAPSAWRCSSIWATRAVRTWYRLLGNTLVTFDQCRLGQEKTTTLSTNLFLRHWHGVYCDHKPEEHRQRNTLMSSDLSRYPWHMMQGLANAIHDYQGPGHHWRPAPQLLHALIPDQVPPNGQGWGLRPIWHAQQSPPGSALRPRYVPGVRVTISYQSDGKSDSDCNPHRKTPLGGQTGGSPPTNTPGPMDHGSACGTPREWQTSPPPEAHEDQKGPPQTDGGTHTQRRDIKRSGPSRRPGPTHSGWGEETLPRAHSATTEAPLTTG